MRMRKKSTALPVRQPAAFTITALLLVALLVLGGCTDIAERFGLEWPGSSTASSAPTTSSAPEDVPPTDNPADGANEHGADSTSYSDGSETSGSASDDAPNTSAQLEQSKQSEGADQPAQPEQTETIQLDNVPAYSGNLSVEINGGVPFFTEADRTRGAFESYSELDELGRAGCAFALITRETMPTEERTGSLSHKPTGWQVDTYDWVDYHFLYNRCHLIAWSLAAEDDNPQNLITGTRTLNMKGMRPFEEKVSSYVYRTNNSVLYRVTPVYWDKNLVASGVLMEAESLEDAGAGVRFCVYCYNVEPGVSINYATGENQADGTKVEIEYTPPAEELEADFVINRSSQVYHYPDCEAVVDMRTHNKVYFQGTLEQLEEQYPSKDGWRLCKLCREKHGN